jgi:hypothetical protein
MRRRICERRQLRVSLGLGVTAVWPRHRCVCSIHRRGESPHMNRCDRRPVNIPTLAVRFGKSRRRRAVSDYPGGSPSPFTTRRRSPWETGSTVASSGGTRTYRSAIGFIIGRRDKPTDVAVRQSLQVSSYPVAGVERPCDVWTVVRSICTRNRLAGPVVAYR